MSTYPDESTVLHSTKRWLTLPRTPPLPESREEGLVEVNGVKIWYAFYGQESATALPIVFLHGGMSSTQWLSLQIEALAPYHRILAIDSRGHGRSYPDLTKPMSYDLLADDAWKVLKHLNISRANFFGWSDGAVLALIIANKHPEIADRICAFAPHHSAKEGVADIANNEVFMTYVSRCLAEGPRLSPTPETFTQFVEQLKTMWGTYPEWTADDLKNVDSAKVLLVEGDHEEAIKKSSTEKIFEWLPDAGLLILPRTSHFALIQAPEGFNSSLFQFFGRGAVRG